MVYCLTRVSIKCVRTLVFSVLSDQGICEVQRRLLLSHLVYMYTMYQGFLVHREVDVPVPFCFQPGLFMHSEVSVPVCILLLPTMDCLCT